ncbi:hypothetical protein DFA_00744 [Cavenderia fasciculata]|uniref:Ankyrin repeat-containing protein n=1 Tax=Cavenderia fasciculata TaxID=261658 RepID=F4PTJ7_CACFS|nr:uncharacterized protein DFA_00744 [Cavenderia fasciculata]EGG20879.1 hypothetical protein DFA_00744 [Cavenderia fasciculata]|eukprot:XP_004358729.1 hypothetical protein DFA_00744 [Cavenderia fasciculata]
MAPPTFLTIFKDVYLRQQVFRNVENISKQIHISKGYRTSRKGRDIIKLLHLEMISTFALPWDFIKHYLPPSSDQLLLKRRVQVINRYCEHRNATYETFKQLLEWSPDYDPLQLDHYAGCFIAIIRSGHEDIVKHLLTLFPDQIPLLKTIDVAAQQGHLSLVQFLFTQPGATYSADALNNAAKNGHLEIVKYLVEQKGAKISDKAINSASFGGYLDILKFLDLHFKGQCKRSITSAATNGHLDVIKYIDANRQDPTNADAMNRAAGAGFLDIVQYLHQNHTEGCTTAAMDDAALGGHFEIVKWLHENRSEGCSTKAMDHAATLEITKFLHYNRTEGCTEHAIVQAAIKGRLDIITFLNDNRTEGCTQKAIDWAASNNHFNVVKYLGENRSEGCSSAAIENITYNQNGDLEMIKYLCSRLGATVSKNAINYACEHGRLDIIEYFDQHCTLSNDVWTINALDRAAGYSGNFEITKYLHENRTEGCSALAMDNAAWRGDLEMVKWLHENRTEGCSTEAMNLATSRGNLEVLKWLHHNRTERCTTSALICHQDDVPVCETIQYLFDQKLITKNQIKKYIQQENSLYFEVQKLICDFANSED